MRVAGLVVAGGEGARIGGEKPFLPFRQGLLIDAVIARVKPQCDALLLNVTRERMDFCRARYGAHQILLADAFDGARGPLGGVIAGLEYLLASGGYEWLASVPCDTPFLPHTLVADLQDALSAGGNPVYAASPARAHYLCALWPVSALERLKEGVSNGAFRGVGFALQSLGGKAVSVRGGDHGFFNVNTRDDLDAAERDAE